MASTTPYIPTVAFPVAGYQRLLRDYTAWWQRHMCVNNLPKVVTWQRNGRELNWRPLESPGQVMCTCP